MTTFYCFMLQTKKNKIIPFVSDSFDSENGVLNDR